MGRGGLLGEPDFRRFWIGETVAQFGQQITQLAVRLTAVIAFGASSGKLGLLNAAAFAPYLLLTRPARLVEGNTKLYASVSAAQIGGPGLGGLLIELIGAPTALLANGIGFMVSVWTLMRVRARPAEPSTGTPGASGIAAGLRFILRDSRLLRSCVLQGALYNLCWMAMQTVSSSTPRTAWASRPA